MTVTAFRPVDGAEPIAGYRLETLSSTKRGTSWSRAAVRRASNLIARLHAKPQRRKEEPR